jgi:flagellar biosynthesis/type III secretory pathway chaperone
MISDESIITILNEQVKTYKALHDLLKQERACLMEFDAERVEELSKEKDTIIMRLRLLEEERQRLIKKYAEENRLGENLNLDDLRKITENDLFGSLRTDLRELLQGIEEMNQFNAVLLDRSLKYIKSTTSFLNIFRTGPVQQMPGALLSKES